ncbi:MAG: hormogonium polysaccharide biosynthesis protein HpsL [Cyanobacteria bacterium J06643_4]
MVSRSPGKKRSIKKSLERTKRRGKKGKSKAAKGEDSKLSLSPRQKLMLEREATAKRTEAITFVAITLLASGFVGLILTLLLSPKLGLAAGLGLMCLILSFKFQRTALYVFVIYLPFAGTVIYVLGGSNVLQIAKDVFYIPALIGVVQFCRKNKLPIILPKAIKAPLIFAVIVIMMNIMFGNLPDQVTQTGGKWPMVMAVWGIKVLLSYIPLVTCIYYLIRDKRDLLWFLRLQVILILIACGLGLIQFVMLRTGICAGTVGEGVELFRADLDARCFVGGSLLYSPEVGTVRLPGTFVAPWQWAWFLISAVFFSFATTFSDESPFWRTVGLVSMVAVMTMAVVSGQRIALLLVPVSALILAMLTGQVKNLKRFLPIGILLGIILAYLIINNPEIVQAQIQSFINRWEASPPQQFIVGQIQRALREQRGIFGYGVGRATNSARIFGDTVLIETYHPKLIHEIGVLGLMAMLALYTTVTVATFRAYRKTKDKNLRIYAASMWVFVLFISYWPYYYPLDVDPVSVYYWLAAGIILKIPEIEQQEQDKAALLKAGGNLNALSKKARRRQKKNEPTFG